ncbi:MAG: ATP synthase F1 subunit gamma [Candidatus Taylorbacteria bacterium]|nr:ATP synthase F1 subunit gamma [Candidatus Taylorbacteria bacterium]
MQGTKEIKRRIKSVKSTKKITKAMELVAASKMKRAVASTLASRLYAEYSWEILQSIANNIEEINHPLFANPVRSPSRGGTADVSENQTSNGAGILLILITSNRGLCGAYNSQVIKKVLTLLKKERGATNIDFITIGKKGDVAMRRLGRKIIATFTELPTNISLSDVLPISKLAIQEYAAGNPSSAPPSPIATEGRGKATAGKYDKVLVAYTDFVSTMLQTANIKQVVPVSKTDLKELIYDLGRSPHLEVSPPSGGGGGKIDYLIEGDKNALLGSLAEKLLIEGDKNALLGSLAEKLVRMQIYQMLLESNASEQSARMVAMKNASDAAGEMIEDLTLVFNKARQAGITQEISEISAGMASVS